MRKIFERFKELGFEVKSLYDDTYLEFTNETDKGCVIVMGIDIKCRYVSKMIWRGGDVADNIPLSFEEIKLINELIVMVGEKE